MSIQPGISLDCAGFDGSLDRLHRELATLTELGASLVELQIHGLDLIWCGEPDQERLTKFRVICREFPLQYTVHAADILNLMAPESERPFHVAAIRATLQVAAAIEAPVVTLHPGRFLPEERFAEAPALLAQVAPLWADRTSPLALPAGAPPGPHPLTDPASAARLLDEEAELLRTLADAAAQLGVLLALENNRPYAEAPGYTYGERPLTLAAQVARIDHPALGLTLDLGHGHLAAQAYGLDLLREIEQVAPLVRHLHVSDNWGRPTLSTEKHQGGLVTIGRGDLHAPPGMGDAPISAALGRLQAAGYGGAAVLELRTRYRSQYRSALIQLSKMLAD